MTPGIDPARWTRFSLDQQILMIANAVNRAGKFLSAEDSNPRRAAYAEALALADLTIGSRHEPGLRRELLRWRDLVAMLYLEDRPSRDEHGAAFRALLQLTPAAFQQLLLMEKP